MTDIKLTKLGLQDAVAIIVERSGDTFAFRNFASNLAIY